MFVFSRGTGVLFLFLFSWLVLANIFSTIRGIVHDPSHRPVAGAVVTLHAKNSEYVQTATSNDDGAFLFASVPAGEYTVEVSASGFSREEQPLVATSSTAPVMHFQLQLGTKAEAITVEETPDAVNPQSMTPSTLVDRREIADTPGADQTNSLRMVTNFVPGAYMTHDQLHVRGGHQVTWAIDGVPIPNTNIASNVGPAIDPKDIDTLEVDRGGYSAEYGDRSYGVFNIVPRTGFESSREMDLSTTYGSFNQSNDQISFGDHTERLGWFGSLDGNRSDYGLETPGPDVLHDRVWGLGGFTSLIFNADPSNQLRFVASARRDDYQIPNDPTLPAANDVERERDAMATLSWVHTISAGTLLTVSPFVHFNRANYDGDPNDTPIATTQHLDSTYAGGQASLNTVTAKHDARIGVYAFAQNDDEFIHLASDTGANIVAEKPSSGGLEAAFLEDQYKLTQWLTLTGGVRFTHFSGGVSENAADPRVGAAIRIPHLNWIVRGFYGAYYQAPPLSTVSGPLLDFALTQGLGIIPLKGERDEENQVGLTIPLRGWTLDFNSFRLRATNYFDHNALGDSNVFFPISIAGARISGQEFTLRSPRLFHRSDVSIVYSHQHAEAEGAVTGGLTDFLPPANGYFLLDHDQRDTLHANFETSLPWRTQFAASAYHGSGFTDGSVDYPAHLQPHTTFDLSFSKAIGENLSFSLNGLNVANRRFLLDNSQTFGGTHYEEPRQVYVQLRYRLHF
jgi:outer membrane receptor protein involved in Fe transport